MRCSLDGCSVEFPPRGSGPTAQRFCSTKHRQIAYARRHPERRAARDASWYARDGWYAQYKRRLERRIRQRLEEV